MSTQPATASYPELVDEASGWLVGGGILTIALFPLALPLLLLTAAVALPFLVIPLVGVLIVAVVAAPILLLRRLLRRIRGVRALQRAGAAPEAVALATEA